MQHSEHLVLLALYEPPGWRDPIPECVGGHNWGYWRRHPNGVDDVRSCRRPGCSYSDWRDTIISANRWAATPDQPGDTRA